MAEGTEVSGGNGGVAIVDSDPVVDPVVVPVSIDHYADPAYSVNGTRSIIGRTPAMLDVFRRMNALLDKPTTVLITGETGTGKELVAQALHYNRRKVRGEFVEVNCAGIPDGLLEAELFGHTKGSFTGAVSDRVGKFEYARDGTIFLDEIGDMPLGLQAKILRVLQERSVVRVGSNRSTGVSVRVVAATNKDLRWEVRKGNFREDLYYRLNVFPIHLPTLAERSEDIPLIARAFVDRFNTRYGTGIRGLTVAAETRLQDHPWPGNIRELENVIERCFVVAKDPKGVIDYEDLLFDREPLVVREKEQKLKPGEWYKAGVLPVTFGDIACQEGALSRETIHRSVVEGPYYFENMSSSDIRRYHVVYLTPQNAYLLFTSISTEDFRVLDRRIKEGAFNRIAEMPFKLYTIPGFISEGYGHGSGEKVRAAVERNKSYVVSEGLPFVFALTLDAVGDFVPADEPKRVNRVNLLRDSIQRAYAQFQEGVPPTL